MEEILHLLGSLKAGQVKASSPDLTLDDSYIGNSTKAGFKLEIEIILSYPVQKEIWKDDGARFPPSAVAFRLECFRNEFRPWA